MSSYKHLTTEERKSIEQFLGEGRSIRDIADILDRSPSTISREVNRNRATYRPHGKPKNPQWYNAWRAEILTIKRRRKGQRTALRSDTEEWNYIVMGLNNYWSPETICGRWHKKYPGRKGLCYATIYRYVKEKRFPDITPEKNLRRKGKKMQTKDANYNTIQPDRIIPEYPGEILTRSRIGDWEGDTVYGGVGKGYLVTMVDRKSRFLCARLLRHRTAAETRKVIEEMLKDMPVESISLDNGSEFAEFHELEESLNTLVYFAEPHKPWQRGTNENTNDILRFFYPKGYDFRSLTEEELQKVVDSINKRPRKILDWKSPYEVFYSVALA